jgi:hypothetical protein
MMLMALPRTIMRSSALQAVAYRAGFILKMRRIFSLSMLLTMSGICTLAGCYLSRTIDQATASDVNNQSFTFTTGAVFHTALANVSTTLSFTDDATSFTLSSAGGTATGSNRFDSCILTVTTSTYGSGAGPQVGDVITLDPCDFDSENKRLTVSNMDLTVTSMVATPFTPGGSGNADQATASDVNNQSFTFDSGAVFHSNLVNVSTSLSFTNTASRFRLSSTGGTANGTNRFGSCILTVTDSDYPINLGPQNNDVIALNPCTFNDTDKTLTVTRGGITATSAPAVVTP